MMRYWFAFVSLLGLCLPASAQSTQPAAPAVAAEGWSYVFTSEQVTTKLFKLPQGMILCAKAGEPLKDGNGKRLPAVTPDVTLSLDKDAELEQKVTVASDPDCKAESLRSVTIKTARPLLRPADLDFAQAVIDADAPQGQIRLLIPSVVPLPASLVQATRLKLKLGPSDKVVESGPGVCLGSGTLCSQIAFGASLSSETQLVQSVAVEATISTRAHDAAAAASGTVYFAGTGAPLKEEDLRSTGASPISLWQFDELETRAAPLDPNQTIPSWTVPWIVRQRSAGSRVRFALETLPRLLVSRHGDEKRLKCIDAGQASKEGHDCAVLTANTLTVTSEADVARLRPGGPGLLLIGHLADNVKVRQRRDGPVFAGDVAIQIRPVECSYSFTQLTTVTAGFHSVEVLYLVTGTAPATCPLPAKVQVAEESGIKVQKQPTRWLWRADHNKVKGQILSMVLEEIKGEPKTYPLTFKFDNDSAITPQTPAYLQIDPAPKFSDPLRVFVQSPFVGTAFAKSSSAPTEISKALDVPGAVARGTGVTVMRGRSPELGTLNFEPAKPPSPPPPAPGIILVDSITTNRNTFFEFGTGRQGGWRLKIRSKGQRPCVPVAADAVRGAESPDEMIFYPNLGVGGAYCLVGMRDENKLDLRVVRRGGGGTPDDRDLALDAAAAKILQEYSRDAPPIDGGWADVSVALPTKPFRLALNLAQHLTFRCVDPELALGGPQTPAADPCQDDDENSSTHPPLRSSSAVYAYSHDALKHCALRIDIPEVSGGTSSAAKTAWEQIQRDLLEWDLQRLQISLALAKTDKDTFQTQSQSEPSTLVLDPTRPQPPDWSKAPVGRRLCKTIDLTQGDRINVEPYARVQLVVEHQDKALYRNDLDFSTPNSRFEVMVRRKPLYGVGASRYCQLVPNLRSQLHCKTRVLDWRMYVSIPLSLTLLRGPSSGAASKVSSDVDVPEVAGFGVGAIGIFEPWNYHQNRPIWGGLGPQIHLGMLTTLPYNALQDTKNLVYPSVSLVAGFGLRLPPSVSPSGSGGGVEAALNAIVWGELMVVSSSPLWRENHLPIPAVLFGLIGQFGAIGN